MDTGQAINNLEGQLSKGKVEKIRKLTERFFRTLYIYKHITITHQKCREVLEKLVQGRGLNQIAALNFFLTCYNWCPNTEITVSGDGVLIEKVFDDKKINGNIPEDYVVDISDSLIGSLTYYLIEFLKKSENKKYISQCKKCQRYFVATRLNGQKFCSDKCRLGWNNKKRIQSGEAAKYKRKKRKEGTKESYYG